MTAWSLTRRFTHPGGEAAWDVLGDGDPVLLVHGFPGNSFTWRSLAPALARDHRVYIVDLIGFGASAQHDGQNVSLAAQTGFVTDFLSRLQVVRPVVVAHDAGAPVVLGAHLLRHVELDRLVLLDPATLNPCISADSLHARRYLEAYQTMPPGLHHAILRTHIASAMYHPMPDEVFWGYFRPWSGPGQAAYYRFIAQLDERYLDDIAARLNQVSCPTRLIWGDRDTWISPATAGRLSALIPGSEVCLIEQAGHFVIDDNPGAVLGAVSEFLSRPPAGPPAARQRSGGGCRAT
jgi:pimeloyl-ACP methyl ester carboxylesterase